MPTLKDQVEEEEPERNLVKGHRDMEGRQEHLRIRRRGYKEEGMVSHFGPAQLNSQMGEGESVYWLQLPRADHRVGRVMALKPVCGE